MYEKYFGLSRDPFSIAPDPRYLFMSERHREALAHLLYGLNAGGGFVLLSGDIGTGKTTVCRCFLEQIPANCNVAYIFNPKLSVEELLTSICDEFHATALPNPHKTANSATTKSLTDRLNTFLLAAHASGQNNVLIIDEAQNLSSDVLEQLRLLTNLETNERKLLQIILIGQPELRGMLARPELEQLAQRVIARFHLEALSPAETTDYIAHRLCVAGLVGPLPFDKKALARVYALSRGVPRRINLLCGRSLLGAYASAKVQVDRLTLDKAAQEVFGADAPANVAAQRDATQTLERQSASKTWLLILLSSVLAVAVGAVVAGAVSFSVFSRGSTNTVAAAGATAVNAVVADTASAALASAASSPKASPLAPVGPLASNLISRADFEAAIAASTATQNQAWGALSLLWGITLEGTDACGAAQAQGVFCYVEQPASLPLIRQLDRPGFLTLTNKNGRSAYALLTGLNASTATLTLDKTLLTVSLVLLADTWNGSFSTLWRRPINMGGTSHGQVTDTATPWLAGQLALLAKNKDTPNVMQAGKTPSVRDRVSSFQILQGLPADGQAGPLSMMQLNRANGLSEPKLVPPKP